MIEYNTLVVLVGVSMLGMSAGLVGCFATLRGRALTGDALAHASLPGVCLAFLIWGEQHLPALLAGAFVIGSLSILLLTALRRWTRIKEDAALGVILSVFFGAGVALLVAITRSKTIGGKSGLESFIFGQTARMISDDVQLIAGVALACLLVVLILYKELRLLVFDPDFAQAQGWPVLGLDLVLMELLTVAVVVALPVVGVVMAAALFIIPAVTARFWTDRLGRMLALAVLCGLVMGTAGTWITARYALPTGPVIILIGAGLFLVSMVAAPRRGVVGRIIAQKRFRRDLEERRLLRALYELTEPSLPVRSLAAFTDIQRRRSWSLTGLRRLLRSCQRQGYLEQQGSDCYCLTGEGLARAADVTRTYRLWELYLTEYADLAAAANLASESLDGLLPASIVAELNAKLGQAGRLPRAPMPAIPEVSG